MLSTYRALLARPGAPRLTAASALAWISYSIYGLGLALVVQRATGSFATAGGVTAAFSLGSGALAPARGRLVDRRGARVLPRLAAVHSLALAGVVVGAEVGASAGALCGLAALGGAAVPPLIATSRARWPVIAGAQLTPTAHAMNAVLADGAGALGPLLLAGLAVLLSPAPALLAFLTGVLAASWLLAHGERRPTTDAGEPPTVERHQAPDAGADQCSARWRGALPGGGAFLVVLGGEALLGAAFGAVEIAALALADRGGTAAVGALPLAVLTATSALTAFWQGARPRSRPPAERLLLGASLAAAAALGMVWPASLTVMVVLAAPLGAGMGMAFVAVLELLDHVVDPARSVEAFTWITTAAAAGTALGAAATGLLAEHGSGPAVLAPAAAGFTAAALLLAAGRPRLLEAAVAASELLRIDSRPG